MEHCHCRKVLNQEVLQAIGNWKAQEPQQAIGILKILPEVLVQVRTVCNMIITITMRKVHTMQCGLPSMILLIFKMQNCFFDVAYAPYGGQYMDTLQVLASTDCGSMFTSFYLKGGVTLATAPALTASGFIPTASQWRTDTVDVTTLAGNSEVLFSFTNIGRFGQIIYVDNINLGATFTSVNEIENDFEFSVFPNPVKNELSVIGNWLLSEKEITIKIYDVVGKEVLNKKLKTSSVTRKRPSASRFRLSTCWLKWKMGLNGLICSIS